MRGGASLVLAAALFASGCASAPSPAPAPLPTPAPERADDAFAAAAATVICPSVAGRVFSAATSHGDARDAFAQLLDCDARAEGSTVIAHAVLEAWLGVSMDAAGARVEQYLHATVTVDARYALSAQYVDHGLLVRLRPAIASRVSVTPVGTVGMTATNWVALAFGELAPTRGTTPEWLAKDRIREVAERMLHEALDRELSVCVDAAHDAFATACPGDAKRAASLSERATLWVAPRGVAFLGPFPPGTSRQLGLKGDAAHVVARTVCLDALAIALAHDRKGEDVPIDDWVPLPIAVRTPVGRGCAWGVALRVDDLDAHQVTLDVSPASLTFTGGAQRWITLHVADIEVVDGDVPAELWLESAVEGVRLDGQATVAWVAELGEGESLHMRARKLHRGAMVAEVVVPADAHGVLELRSGGALFARVSITARAVDAPRARP